MRRPDPISTFARSTVISATALAMMSLSSPAFGQQDPTELGGGKKPYVLIIIDSSASMEFTTVGDNKFPTVDRTGDGIPDPHWYMTAPAHREWRPGVEMDVSMNNAWGACWTYHPSTNLCDDYVRPGWKALPYEAGWPIPAPPVEWNPASGPGGHNENRNGFVNWDARGDWSTANLGLVSYGGSGHYGWRLQNPTQPRHVTIKEILTGNMILLPRFPSAAGPTSFEANFYNANEFGPGCWFIPRQRDASVQPLSDQTYCAGDLAFEELPDFDQPVPHFQEFYDLQQPTGVLDTLRTSALFAVAAFDGFRDDLRAPESTAWKGYNSELNDEIAGTYPTDDVGWRDANRNEDSADCDGDGTADDPCYNLGIWRVIGPSNLEVPATILPELSAYTQVAINDTGFLHAGEGEAFTLYTDQNKSKNNSWLGATFSKNFKNYAKDIDLGKQPIARATPIAAAIHDVYQFMAYGQGSGGDAEDPINEDAFAECRPKHVVILTDGQPSPERDPSNALGVSDTLNEAFGYDATRYTYQTSEQEIAYLVEDRDDMVPPSNSAPITDRDKYNVRVHIVGLNLDTRDDDAIAKMARMAMEGNSCAEALLPSLVPAAMGGPCAAGSGCLVDQSAAVNAYDSGYDWTHPATGDVIPCRRFPALIIDDNDPQKLSAALHTFMSALIDTSGLTSRTRLVVTNRLDDVAIGGGGQHRVYSGVRVGGASWWQGVLNRTTVRCDGVDDPELSLDQQIGEQVTLAGGNPADSRRVWTAIPQDTIWDFASGGIPISPISPSGLADYPMQYSLRQVGASDDEFGDTYLTNDASGEALVVGSRVPFEYSFIDVAYPIPPFADFNVADAAEFRNMVNVFRGRVAGRVSDDPTFGGALPDLNGENQFRVLGGILNSNPIVVGPPNLDLPIASYRDFRARYADRATMLYVSSMDGLLHAIHTGTLTDRVNKRNVTEADAPRAGDVLGSADEQREAWAYVPWMVHRDLSSYQDNQAYLMDGSPVAKDVRLCNQDKTKNTNVQACEAVCVGTCTALEGADQWRTVLVQGRGLAGAGYYAMDITRPGGLHFDAGGGDSIQNPDPVLLWEFDREWEAAQLDYFFNVAGDAPRVSSSGVVSPDSSYWNVAECGNNEDNFWQSPLIGLSVSEPEIATVIVNGAQRPVAVFGGGGNDLNHSGCGSSGSGMAIYVVDLQTGSILRRFTHYTPAAGTPTSFMHPSDPNRFVGSPALLDSSTGAIATRGFIGDAAGRLFKIDFLETDPLDWEVSLFFDPSDSTDLDGLYSSAGHSGSPEWGPGAYRPAAALDANRNVMVVYGLGEVGDVVTNDQAQAIITLMEDRTNPETGTVAWAEVFPPGEKVTGAPIIFNNQVYFPTYALPTANVCDPGFARIWGLRLPDSDDTRIDDVVGVFGSNPAFAGPDPDGIIVDPTAQFRYFGPDEPTLIRGLTVTLGALCSVDVDAAGDPVFSAGDRPKPQLIAQTSGPVDNEFRNTDASSNPAQNALDRVVLDIEPPASQTLPLSWSLIY